MTEGYREFYERYWRSPAGDAVDEDRLTPQRLREFARAVPVPSRILDAGCGSGRTTVALRRMGYDAIGIELSREALKAAPRDVLAFARCAVDQALPFRDGIFDAVYCAEVLEHLFDPSSAVRECARVIRKGGRIVASVPFHGRWKNVLIALTSFETHFDPAGQHIRFFTARTLRRLFENEGIRVRSVRNLGRLWPIYMNMIMIGEKV